MLSRSVLTTLLLTASTAFAQTFTSCNPLNATCPSDLALGTTATFNWTQAAADNKVWNATAGQVDFAQDGGRFIINGRGDSPTLRSAFYIMFGRVSVVMKAATGVGVVSSIVLESDDLDEVDWEIIGGNTTFVETNFFGKGNTTSYDRAIWYPIDNTLIFHNYTTVWTADKLEWYIDDNLVRTLQFDDAVANYGKNYPQTPMYLQIGNWVGGDPTENSNGTVEWAGGEVDYSQAPFTMTIASVEVEDFTQGSSYSYGDRSGNWQSIKVASGNSTIAEYLNAPHGVSAHFALLPRWAKVAIAVGAVSVAAIMLGVLTFCCIKQRRAGKRERAIADAEWERNVSELRQYKRMHISEEEIHPRARGKDGWM